MLTVCATVGGFVVGALMGRIFGGMLGAMGVPIRTIKVICGLIGFVAGLPVSYLFFRLFVSRFIVNKLVAPTSDSVTPAQVPIVSRAA